MKKLSNQRKTTVVIQNAKQWEEAKIKLEAEDAVAAEHWTPEELVAELSRRDPETGRTLLHWLCKHPANEHAMILALRVMDLCPKCVLTLTRADAGLDTAGAHRKGSGSSWLACKSTSPVQ